MYMKGNAFLDNNHANQMGAILFYTLSRRTTVYLTSIYQRANEDSQAQISGITDPEGSSSGSSQAVVRIGIHALFWSTGKCNDARSAVAGALGRIGSRRDLIHPALTHSANQQYE
jgi:hypothetical protein